MDSISRQYLQKYLLYLLNVFFLFSSVDPEISAERRYFAPQPIGIWPMSAAVHSVDVLADEIPAEVSEGFKVNWRQFRKVVQKTVSGKPVPENHSGKPVKTKLDLM